MNKGVLYGVGVGPGDPGLLTLKAVDTIRKCPVVAAPRTKNGMVALDIAREAVDISGKTVLPLDFAMSRDAAARAASHRKAAAALRDILDAGESVAMLNLGDVSIFASFRYVADILSPEGYAVRMVAGVPSFCAAAAALGTSLTDMETPLRIMPDASIPEDSRLDGPGTTIWMKSGKRLPELLATLRARGSGEEVAIVQNCGMPDQRIYRGLGEEIGDGYFSLVIVKRGGERT